MRKAEPVATEESRPPPRPSPKGEEEKRHRKLSYNETRELEALPAKLEALEREQAELAARLADPATYQDRATDARALSARHEAIEAQLTALLARWEALESRA
jgi:ATP-binding cassette subfamily F protein uup